MPDEFQNIARQVAKRFLQTVLVVDDQPTSVPAEAPNGGAQEPPQRSLPDAEKVEVTAQQEEAEPEAGPEWQLGLDPKALTEAFAEMGVVCAVLTPSSNDRDGFVRRYTAVAGRADIVVLDWILGQNDGGDEAIRLLGELAQGERSRLIAIYTGQSNLNLVLDPLKHAQLPGGARLVEARQDPWSLCSGPIRVTVFSKIQRGNVDGRYVAESDLPERLVDEYAKMSGGLLGSLALAALAAIREDSHDILRQFPLELDAAFVAEWAAQHKADEVEGHWLPLVMDEVEAAIEDDADVARLRGVEAICSWAGIEAPGETGGRELVVERLSGKLPGEVAEQLRRGKAVREDIEDLTRSIGKVDGLQPAAVLQRVGLMFQNRRRNNSSAKVMRPGTVVEMNGKYWICVQPACDCIVRGKDPRRLFWFAQMEKAPSKKPSKDDEEELPLDEVRLWNPDANGAGGVSEWLVRVGARSARQFVLERTTGSSFVRATEKGVFGASVLDLPDSQRGMHADAGVRKVDLKWVMDLKPPRAQEVTERLARSLSRVGVTQSEWLRVGKRKATKSGEKKIGEAGPPTPTGQTTELEGTPPPTPTPQSEATPPVASSPEDKKPSGE
jgi:hypothetical protein